jgi:ornithine carbamoyltransferase
MFDAIAFRGFTQQTADVLSEYSAVPVVNGLTDSYHPTQGLADFMTMQEVFGGLEGKKLCYLGDGRNNVARTLMIGSIILGIRLSIGSPEELQPDDEIVNICKSLSGRYSDLVSIESNPQKAVSGADAVYTDVWVSMGEEEREAERLSLLGPYRVTNEIMDQTGKAESIFLHCLPAVRGNEVSPEVMDGPRSRIWDQAENRKHTIKAVLLALCGLD